MYAFDRDGVLAGILGNFAAGHPQNYKGAEMPLIEEVLAIAVIFSLIPARFWALLTQVQCPRGAFISNVKN